MPKVICPEPDTKPPGLDPIPVNDICAEAETKSEGKVLITDPDTISDGISPSPVKDTCPEPDTKPDGLELMPVNDTWSDPENNVKAELPIMLPKDPVR